MSPHNHSLASLLNPAISPASAKCPASGKPRHASTALDGARVKVALDHVKLSLRDGLQEVKKVGEELNTSILNKMEGLCEAVVALRVDVDSSACRASEMVQQSVADLTHTLATQAAEATSSTTSLETSLASQACHLATVTDAVTSAAIRTEDLIGTVNQSITSKIDSQTLELKDALVATEKSLRISNGILKGSILKEVKGLDEVLTQNGQLIGELGMELSRDSRDRTDLLKGLGEHALKAEETLRGRLDALEQQQNALLQKQDALARSFEHAQQQVRDDMDTLRRSAVDDLASKLEAETTRLEDVLDAKLSLHCTEIKGMLEVMQSEARKEQETTRREAEEKHIALDCRIAGTQEVVYKLSSHVAKEFDSLARTLNQQTQTATKHLSDLTTLVSEQLDKQAGTPAPSLDGASHGSSTTEPCLLPPSSQARPRPSSHEYSHSVSHRLAVRSHDPALSSSSSLASQPHLSGTRAMGSTLSTQALQGTSHETSPMFGLNIPLSPAQDRSAIDHADPSPFNSSQPTPTRRPNASHLHRRRTPLAHRIPYPATQAARLGSSSSSSSILPPATAPLYDRRPASAPMQNKQEVTPTISRRDSVPRAPGTGGKKRRMIEQTDSDSEDSLPLAVSMQVEHNKGGGRGAAASSRTRRIIQQDLSHTGSEASLTELASFQKGAEVTVLEDEDDEPEPDTQDSDE